MWTKLSYAIVVLAFIGGICFLLFTKYLDIEAGLAPDEPVASMSDFKLIANEILSQNIDSTQSEIDKRIYSGGPDGWFVRGTIRPLGAQFSKPFFLELAPICSKWELLSCWSTVTLMINGKEVNFDRSIGLDRPEQADSSQPTDAETKTADNVRDGEQIASAGVKTEDDNQNQELWRTTNENVRGRAGPGTSYDIVRTISPEIGMILLERSTEWGKFKLVGTNIPPLWVYMPLVAVDGG